MFLGSVMYGYHDLEYHSAGYVWALLHNLSMTCYLVLIKLNNSQLDLKANEMSVYNNVLSLPFLVRDPPALGVGVPPTWLLTSMHWRVPLFP